MNLWVSSLPAMTSSKEFLEFIDKSGMDLKSELDIPTSVDKFVRTGDNNQGADEQ